MKNYFKYKVCKKCSHTYWSLDGKCPFCDKAAIRAFKRQKKYMEVLKKKMENDNAKKRS